jgi:hypothetical protein
VLAVTGIGKLVGVGLDTFGYLTRRQRPWRGLDQFAQQLARRRRQRPARIAGIHQPLSFPVYIPAVQIDGQLTAANYVQRRRQVIIDRCLAQRRANPPAQHLLDIVLVFGDKVGGGKLFQRGALDIGAGVLGQVNDRQARPLFMQRVRHRESGAVIAIHARVEQRHVRRRVLVGERDFLPRGLGEIEDLECIRLAVEILVFQHRGKFLDPVRLILDPEYRRHQIANL